MDKITLQEFRELNIHEKCLYIVRCMSDIHSAEVEIIKLKMLGMENSHQASISAFFQLRDKRIEQALAWEHVKMFYLSFREELISFNTGPNKIDLFSYYSNVIEKALSIEFYKELDDVLEK